MTPTTTELHSRQEQAQAQAQEEPKQGLAMQDEAATEKARRQEERRDFLAGIRKLIRSFKSLSHIFELYKEGDDDEEDGSGVELNIEIGFPTDVQHVAHIGLDGSSNLASLRGMQEAQELLSLSNHLSLEQFELAMASLARHEHGVVDGVAPN